MRQTLDDPLDIRMGVYRHHKGPLYLVQGLSHDANADEFYDRNGAPLFPNGRITVDYSPLYTDPTHLGPVKADRTLDDFLAWVPTDVATGEALLESGRAARRTSEGVWERPRFEFLGPVRTADMMDVSL